jgi:hypothetical protein
VTGETISTSEAAEILGLKDRHSARRALHRLGLRPVARQPGRSGENLYDRAEVEKAKRPGRGARTDRHTESEET